MKFHEIRLTFHSLHSLNEILSTGMRKARQYNPHIFNRFNLRSLLLSMIAVLVCSFGMSAAPGGSRRVVGVVTDSITGERLSFVNVYSKKAHRGVTTDLDGVFTIHLPVGSLLEVSMMGFYPQSAVVTSSRDTIRFKLVPEAKDLSEVFIKPGKQKYSKKNPAVELIRRVREDRKKQNPEYQPLYSYDRYDKMVFALNNYKGYMPDADGKVKGKMKALAKMVDTAVWTGKRVLDLSVKEKAATKLFTGSPSSGKEIVRGFRSSGLDKNLDENYTRVFMEDVMREVDIYENDIDLMKARFVSPLSSIGPDFYMYHIEDTVNVGGEPCVEISFAPHNPESYSFNGKLYVPVNDSLKYVKRVLMRVPKAANVNFIDNMIVSQTYAKDSLGMVGKTLDDMVVEMSVVGNFGEMYASRQSRYRNQSYDRREDLGDYYDKIGWRFDIDESDSQSDEFWQEQRLVPLTYTEARMMESKSLLKDSPILYWGTKIVEVFVKGYIPTGKKSKFDIGAIDRFVSYNATEGWRLYFGGLTTANLSKRLFARAYAAYGFRDHRWKYMGELEYSFVDKKYHSREFPMNGIRFTYKYDLNQIGERFATNAGGNIFYSFRRLQSNLSTYQRLASLEYNIEWRNHLSFNATLASIRQEDSPHVKFIDGFGRQFGHYNQNSLKVRLRYSPKEKFIQNFDRRTSINKDALVLQVSHEFGPKGVFGSDFTMNLTEFMVQKRVWMSMFGYVDMLFKGAKLWNQVQFPALLWQNANTSYSMRPETFSLMNPMEFAMDEYLSWDITYNLNGLIFNRIPFVKKARLREIFTFKGVWGHLSKKNNPEYNDNLFRFPEGSFTRAIGSTPYMEIGVGIANIFSCLRLDYVWRLTYRDSPGAPNHGLRFSFLFSF